MHTKASWCTATLNEAAQYRQRLDKTLRRIMGDTLARVEGYACTNQGSVRVRAYASPDSDDSFLVELTCTTSLGLTLLEAFDVPSEVGHLRRLGVRLCTESAPLDTTAVQILKDWSNLLDTSRAEEDAPSFDALLAACAGTQTPEDLSVRKDLRTQVDYYRSLVDELVAEIAQLKSERVDWSFKTSFKALAESHQEEDVGSEREVSDLSDAVTAIAEEHSATLVVLPRALAGAKKSLYEQPQLVLDALRFLATSYHAHRTGAVSLDKFQLELQSLGMRLSGSTTATVAGGQGAAYFVPWDGKRRFLDWHLAKGGGRDERYCLRIYFFWCTSSNRCVVGWLPSHLRNSLS